ncbi:uncharacterized protein [Panulirus ornatus]|uniref:uncharacterized protein isoform X1 n=1 Tax=Panulirus ornatus TaxID=150431 RepID=UPI003A895782
MMVGWQVMTAVLCLALGPTMAQITFSRSWVPQGKRSGAATIPLASPRADPEADICRDVRLNTLAQVASHLADLMDETSDVNPSNMNTDQRLQHSLRQRRML